MSAGDDQLAADRGRAEPIFHESKETLSAGHRLLCRLARCRFEKRKQIGDLRKRKHIERSVRQHRNGLGFAGKFLPGDGDLPTVGLLEDAFLLVLLQGIAREDRPVFGDRVAGPRRGGYDLGWFER